tara:strand:+ start:53 stop:1378 length:1326 start_codon:yes stop_codon:yes gene_type:complete
VASIFDKIKGHIDRGVDRAGMFFNDPDVIRAMSVEQIEPDAPVGDAFKRWGAATLGGPGDIYSLIWKDLIGAESNLPGFRSLPTSETLQKRFGAPQGPEFMAIDFLASDPFSMMGKTIKGARQIRKKIGSSPQDNKKLSGLSKKEKIDSDRLKRAEKLGFKKDVYHGTYSDFSEFDLQNDLGVHVGTPEQAYNRLIDIEKYKTFKGTRGGVEVGQGGQIIPLKAKIKKSLNMKDVGDWKNPYEVLLHLRSTPLGKKYQTKFDEIEDEMTPIIESFIYGEENWTDSIEAAGYMDELRDIIGKEGYDSIKYVNEVENTYGSLAGLTPKGKKEKERLQKEVKKINDEVGKRDQELVPKLGASAEEIEKFNKTNPTTITPEEVKKREQLILQIREVEKNEVYDPHSYIILNPKQLRSINADFDPEKIEELDILSQLQKRSEGLFS